MSDDPTRHDGIGDGHDNPANGDRRTGSVNSGPSSEFKEDPWTEGPAAQGRSRRAPRC